MSRTKLLVAGLVAALMGGTAPAATILVDSGQQVATIQTYDPIGQSFTSLGGELVSIGLMFATLNSTAPQDSVTVSLLSGRGLGGSVLGTQTQTLTPTLASSGASATFTDFTLGSILLTAGAEYTISVLNNGSGARNGIVFGPDPVGPAFPSQQYEPDAYAGGQMYFATGNPGACATSRPNCDLNFRVVTNDVAAVPEPATWAMMIGGFGLIGGEMRRRVRTAAIA